MKGLSEARKKERVKKNQKKKTNTEMFYQQNRKRKFYRK